MRNDSDRMVSRATAAFRLANVTSHVSPQLHPHSNLSVSRSGPHLCALNGVRLDDDAMRSFIADGFLLLDTTTELTPRWHATVVEKAAGLVKEQPAQRTRPSSVAPAGAAVDQAMLWSAMSPELHRVTSSHVVCGALASILGNDFVLSPGGHMHEAATLDQFWHRDGSVRGIREHAARGLIVMYYPNGCTLDMGCTAVCRGSQFLTVDRQRWPNSEDRLDVGAPPHSSVSDEQALAHWRLRDEKARGVPSMDDPVGREQALAAPVSNLGLFAEDAEVRVVVPRGGVLLCHRECFHRATRAVEGAAWRPMFKLGASRVCDPVNPSWVFSTHQAASASTPFDVSIESVARTFWSWHCGTVPSQLPAVAGLTVTETHAVAAVLAEPAATEAERISAAYFLGEMVAKCHGASTSVAASRLLQSLDAETETSRRAASYGLRAALLTHTNQQPNLQQQYLAEALRVRLQSPFECCGGTVGGSTAVVYILAAAPMPYKATATALSTFVTRTIAELAAYTRAQPTALLKQWGPLLSDRVQLRVPLDFWVLDRRLALSECCGALASVGERAVRSGECEIVDLVARVLLALVTAKEPGASFLTFFGPSNGQAIRMQAAFAMLRVCSDPNLSFGADGEGDLASAMLCSNPEWVRTTNPRNVPPQRDTVATTVAEAFRRLRLLCSTPASQLASLGRMRKAREHLLATLESTPLPWRSVLPEVTKVQSKHRQCGLMADGDAILQHCSTAAPFPAVAEVGVY